LFGGGGRKVESAAESISSTAIVAQVNGKLGGKHTGESSTSDHLESNCSEEGRGPREKPTSRQLNSRREISVPKRKREVAFYGARVREEHKEFREEKTSPDLAAGGEGRGRTARNFSQEKQRQVKPPTNSTPYHERGGDEGRMVYGMVSVGKIAATISQSAKSGIRALQGNNATRRCRSRRILDPSQEKTQERGVSLKEKIRKHVRTSQAIQIKKRPMACL